MLADRIVFVCIIALAAVYFYATAQIPQLDIGDPLGPRAFPRLLGVGLLVTAALLLVEMFKKRTERIEASPAQVLLPAEGRHLLVLAGVVFWTGLYFALFEPAGYLLSTSVFLLGLMAYFHRGHWLANVLTAVGFSLGSYLLFVKLLMVTLAKGIVYF